MIHELKTHPEYFQPILDGTKTFELRRFDRPFAVNDFLVLREYIPNKGYTGRRINCSVCYLFDNPDFGIKKGYCILGITKISLKKKLHETQKKASD